MSAKTSTPHPAGIAGAHLAQVVGDACACRRCLRERDARDPTGWPILLGTMIVCLTCGNKRCPNSESHEYACTGSNDPGQADGGHPALAPHEERNHG